MRKAWLGLAILGAAMAADAPPPGGISGKVVWEGEVPEPRKTEVEPDAGKGCACPKEGKLVKVDESLVVDAATRGVAHCVVWLKGVKGGPVLGPAEIDQKGCVFSPHVALITPGQKVKLLNPEKIEHNFHWAEGRNPGGNLPPNRFRPFIETAVFEKPEFIKVACDIHSWMGGWIAVMENGYAARTDGKGAFKIEGIPPGKYVLALWHEPVPPEGKPFLLQKEVVVEAGKTGEAGFTMGAKP